MPKLAILADPHSTHTIKWVKNLSRKGFQILLIGISDRHTSLYNDVPNVNCKCYIVNKKVQRKRKLDFIKLTNLKHFFKIKKTIKDYEPDILHSFYASSYGLIGALCSIKPFVISVWGSDVFEFPKKSILHEFILKFSLNKATCICATGQGLKTESKKYTSNKIHVIPFGINIDYFKPVTKTQKDTITIGTVKHFKKIYGIETLIKSISLLKQDENYSNLKLLLIGDGEEKKNYIKLANKLGIVNDINFTGFISNEHLHPQYQKMDIVVIPSIRESFGISVLEGMSCEIPVIASDISGFNEVGNNETITFFEPENEIDLANKIKVCITDYKAYKVKAVKARERVATLFSEKACLEKKVNLYKQLLDM